MNKIIEKIINNTNNSCCSPKNLLFTLTVLESICTDKNTKRKIQELTTNNNLELVDRINLLYNTLIKNAGFVSFLFVKEDTHIGVIDINSNFCNMSTPLCKDIFKKIIQDRKNVLPQESITRLNKIISKKTNGLINNTIDNDNSVLDSLFLCSFYNILYIQDCWAEPFKIIDVGEFRTSNGIKKINLIMYQLNKNYYYFENEKIQVLELPTLNNFLVGFVLLNNENDAFTFNNIPNTEKSYKKIDIIIPKFVIEKKINVKNILMELAIDIFDIFDKDKNAIQGLTDNKYLSDIIQIVRFEIKENNTNITNNMMHYGKQQPIEFIATRPFYYYIKHQHFVCGEEPIFFGKFTGIN